MSDAKPVVIVPCSGIGKAFGTVAREVGYELCDELRPSSTQLVALSKLVLGEKEARDKVRACPSITVDGCKLACAAKLVKQTGGTIAREVAVLDSFRQHKDLRPEGIAELNPEGKQLASIMAEEIAQVVDGLGKPSSGGSHA